TLRGNFTTKRGGTCSHWYEPKQKPPLPSILDALLVLVTDDESFAVAAQIILEDRVCCRKTVGAPVIYAQCGARDGPVAFICNEKNKLGCRITRVPVPASGPVRQ